MSRTKNQIIRPSGLRQSKDGGYIYANCAVTGKFVPMKADYFAKVLERFGNDEARFVKEYVFRSVTKLREEGKTDDEIRTILGNEEQAAPKAEKAPKVEKAEKAVKQPKVEKVAKVKHIKATDTIISPVVGEKAGTEVKSVTYSWSGDPQNYFKSATRGVINWAEATKETCFFPGTCLDSQCFGCSIFDKCVCASKISDEKRAKLGRGGQEKPVVKAINLTGNSAAKPVAEQTEAE